MYNNKIQGVFFITDEDGIKHEVCVSVLADMENATFYALVTIDGEPVAPGAAPSVEADIYVKWTMGLS